MLDTFIIEELLRRERQREEQARDDRRPRLEMPRTRREGDAPPPDSGPTEKSERGVIVIDL